MADGTEQLPPPALSLQEPSSLSPPRQQYTFGAFAYERVLSEPECHKVQRLQRRLAASLDGTIHVWVQDARPFAHDKESAIDVFQLRLHASLPVAEVRDRIQERFEELSSYRGHADGPLQLFFGGRVLEDGKLLAEYLSTTSDKPQRKWAAPFAGILWVVPFRPATGLAPHMWST